MRSCERGWFSFTSVLFFWAVFCRVQREYERVSLYNR